MADGVSPRPTRIDRQFGPRHKFRFLLRIRLRIWKLRLALWWRTPKAAAFRLHWPKPAALIAVGVIVPILTGWVLSKLFPAEAHGVGGAVSNLLTGPGAPRLEWREAAQLLLVLVGIPSAFLLWLFRDVNVSGTLENQRKDVNLKEFQEIQMRAAGAMDEALPAAARETLQIAALHQLRGFLRGEYGDSFRRPALELLRARLMASAMAVGTQAIGDWMAGWRKAPVPRGRDRLKHIGKMRRNVRKALDSLRPSRVADTERSIVREEWQAVFRSGMPLAGSTFDMINLPNCVLADVDLAGCRFIGASLGSSHLEEAILSDADLALAKLVRAHLEAADLRRAHLECVDLQRAHLQHAHLQSAHLEGADLRWAQLHSAHLDQTHLEGANLAGASLDGADLFYAHLQGANLTDVSPDAALRVEGAEFDSETQFAPLWFELPEHEQDAIRALWVTRGATRVR